MEERRRKRLAAKKRRAAALRQQQARQRRAAAAAANSVTYGNVTYWPGTLELMAQTMAILNPAYFSGYAAQLREEVKASDHYAMWRKHSGFAPIGYINSMLEEQDQDPRQVVVELN